MMTTKMAKNQEISMTVEVNTPDGTLYLTICDGPAGTPSRVISTFGKAGTTLAAWANATDVLINLLLEHGIKINEIIERLDGISHSKPLKTEDGVRVGSGPQGIVVALMEYKRQKFRQLRESFESPDF